jgi:glycerol kinase
MTYLLALDQGTTSSRALLVDGHGAIVGMAQRELAQSYPQPGWVEHDPEEIWSSQVATAHEVLARHGVAPREVTAIGITNQRETTVVWERATGRPIHPAIVWQDRRTAEMCEGIRARGLAPWIQERTGLLPDPYFSGTKLAWILEHVPGARARAEAGDLCFGTIDSWLIWKLTGGRVHATDASNASRTLLMNLERGVWDPNLLAMLDIPEAMLPAIVNSSGFVGETHPDAMGAGAGVGGRVGAGIPILGVAGDQQAALFGQTAFEPGLAKNTYGTGCFLMMNVGERPIPSTHQLLSTVAWRIGGRTEFALEGSIFVAGAVVQWLRDGLGIIRSAEEVEALARQVADSGGVYLVPAFAGLGAPQWDPRARGTIVGITRGTTAAHLARAALEGIAFQVADVVGVMGRDAGFPMEALRVDGGASANGLLMQMQADLLERPVVRPRFTETTALGAAFLAGLAAGVWPNRDAIREHWQISARFEPSLAGAEVAERQARWRDALRRSEGWAV